MNETLFDGCDYTMIHPTPRLVSRDRPDRLAGRTRSMLAALVLVCVAAPGELRAQEDKLPEAETILEKYVEVTGGKVAYGKLNNRVTKATLEFVGMGIKVAMRVGEGVKVSMTSYAARPDKMYNLAESEVLPKIETGTDGKVAWETSLLRGPQIKEDHERAFIMRMATFDKDVNWRKLYKSAQCVGIETIDDKLCYKIVLTAKEGPPETRYYDKKSNLLVKTETPLKLHAGEFLMEIFPSDYKRVDGILMPHKERILVNRQERIMTVESIKHNVKIPKDRFKLPADIQELVDRKESEKGKAKKP